MSPRPKQRYEPAASHSTYTQGPCTTKLLLNSPRKPSQSSFWDLHWEVTAAAFSSICFVAVVGVLILFDEKSFSTWSFVFNISINTIIVVLSTLSRTALLVPVASCISQLKWIHIVEALRRLYDIQMFDDASRGPWGSVVLIWNLHIRTKLATWGSSITTLTLAMRPFAQQLLSYSARPVFSDGATFRRSRVYDSSYGTYRTLERDLRACESRKRYA